MKEMRTAGLMLMLSILALPASASEAKTYSGQIAETKMSFTATIDAYTSDDATFALAEKLLKKGQQGMIESISALKAGRIQFDEGAAYEVNVVRTLQTEQGLLVAFVTDRPLNTETSRKPTSPGPSLGYLELLLNDDGTGGGRLVSGAKVIFNEDGYMQAESTGGQVLTLKGVAPE